jgi:hypothetical protein
MSGDIVLTKDGVLEMKADGTDTFDSEMSTGYCALLGFSWTCMAGAVMTNVE